MNNNINKHGLSRVIPAAIKQEVRRKSKFGCVICRTAIFEYEHIDPEFSEANKHEADAICCLCPSCHSKVTRKIYSKAFVKKKYSEIQNSDRSAVRPPFDFLDFHSGLANVKLGGIDYDVGLTTILKFHGEVLIEICPVNIDGSSGINARFFDRENQKILEIIENEWVGSLDAWDLEAKGRRIKIRRKQGDYSLVLRLEPPRSIIIEKLDMKYKDMHFLMSDKTHAIGRYVSLTEIFWLHANILSMGAPLPDASAIEILTPVEIEIRDRFWNGRGQGMATADRSVVMQTGLGIAYKPMGLLIGSGCLRFNMAQLACGGPRPLDKMRSLVFKHPKLVPKFIGTGE